MNFYANLHKWKVEHLSSGKKTLPPGVMFSNYEICIAVEFFEKIYVEFYGSGSHVVGMHLFSVTILVGGKFCNLGSTGFDHGKMIK